MKRENHNTNHKVDEEENNDRSHSVEKVNGTNLAVIELKALQIIYVLTSSEVEDH